MNYIKPLTIGSLTTRHNVILAPLAGITDYPFREMCRQYGADLTFTEMVSADGFVHGNDATRRLLKVHPTDHPIGFQLFGNNPEVFKRTFPDIATFQPDVLDLNFGCPMRKIVGKGAGAALLKDLNSLQKIVETVKQETPLPVTTKIRIGWDEHSIVAIDAALAAQAGGADAISVHARTRNQGYAGAAQWEYIAAVKSAVKIPVIGNGDVFSGGDALEMFHATAADGIMLARGALGRPWIFREIMEYLKTGETLAAPSPEKRVTLVQHHYEMAMEELGEDVALARMKKHIVWYTHGLPNAAGLRNSIFRCGTVRQIRHLFESYLMQNLTAA